MRPAIFLDRDGVINYNRSNYVKSWQEFEFLPRSLEALHLLNQLGRPTVVVTNQSAIGRGIVSHQEVAQINALMKKQIERVGGRIDRVLYCPHRPEDECNCRKPQPGMILSAASQLGLEPPLSFMVGDAMTDVLAAQAAGCLPIIVQTGRGRDQLRLLRQNGIKGYYVAEDLLGAVQWIMQLQRIHVLPMVRQPTIPTGVSLSV